MQPTNRRLMFPLIGLLFLAGCGATPDAPDGPSYATTVFDKRGSTLEVAKVVEGEGVRLFVGEGFLGPSLIDIFHRQMTLRAPKLPQRHVVEVTDLEVSVLVTGSTTMVDPGPALMAKGRYRPAPGALVLDEIGGGASQTLRVRIAYRLDGLDHEVLRDADVGANEVRERAELLYGEAIASLIAQLKNEG